MILVDNRGKRIEQGDTLVWLVGGPIELKIKEIRDVIVAAGAGQTRKIIGEVQINIPVEAQQIQGVFVVEKDEKKPTLVKE